MSYQRTPSATPNSPPDTAAIISDCRDFFLEKLGQLLQEGSHLPAAALSTFQQGVGRYYDEMTSPARKSGFDDSKNLTASRISLVGENDLEMEIRLGEFSARLQEKAGNELWRVYLRFVTLLKRPDLAKSDNPVGPKGIGEGINDLCLALPENHDKRMERIERLEDHFAENLHILYDELNDFLATRQVGAAHPNLITSPDTGGRPPPSASNLALNAAALLQRNQMGNQGVYGGASPSGGGGGAAGNLLNQAMLDRLLARLNELERHGTTAPGEHAAQGYHFATPHTASDPDASGTSTFKSNTPHILKSKELGVPSGAPEAASIDTLALIFEAIFASESLPETIKSALASLQIPLLKVAMLDNSLFTNEKHPARQLLDKMARAALGLPLDVPAKHPLCNNIQAIASLVRNKFAGDMQVFSEHADKLDMLCENRTHTANRIANTYQPLLARLEQQNQANLRCRQVIGQYCSRNTPESIVGFLRHYWQPLLQKLWLDGGEQGEAWKTHLSIIEKLLWSIQPKTEIEERKKLARILPVLLKELNTGMDEVAMPETERNAFLDSCFTLQTAAMRGISNPPSVKPAQPNPTGEEATCTFGEIRLGDLLLKTCQSTQNSLTEKHLATTISPGQWLSFDYNGEILCGCLCRASGQNPDLLLVNPDWDFAVAMPAGLLAQQLLDKRAHNASITSLFDSAAEKALQGAPKHDVLA